MLDLLIKKASLPDGRTGVSVAVQGGRISAIEPALDAPVHEVVDASGYFLSPHFVDPHFHMDATLSYGLPRVNEWGTLLEGIAPYIDLQLVAFPQDGALRTKGPWTTSSAHSTRAWTLLAAFRPLSGPWLNVQPA